MSEIVDAQMAEYFMYGDNPEGFPRCPKCQEFVFLEENLNFYTCSNCGYKFPLEESL